MGRAGKLYIGTSGWSYKHWAGGRFYPKGLRPGEWLSYLASQFPTVEVNSTFYRLPQESVIDRWHSATGREFRFAVKLWRMITHRKKLVDCEELLRNFFRVVGHFRDKRGPLLVQLPPSVHFNVELLDAFLTQLRRAAKQSTWRIAVEFRHASWAVPETLRLLDRHGVALCLADMARCPFTQPGGVDFVYVRRHGPGGRYRGCYSPEHIAADARQIREWLAAGRDVYVYYNNDVGGHAVDNARQLIEACAPAVAGRRT